MKSMTAAIFLAFCFAASGCGEDTPVANPAGDVLPADLTAVETEFINLVRDAYERRDPQPVLDRVHWEINPEEFPEEIRGLILKSWSRSVKSGMQTMRFERVDPETHTQWTQGDVKVHANLPVKWLLSVDEIDPISPGFVANTTMDFRLGEVDGKIMFADTIADDSE